MSFTLRGMLESTWNVVKYVNPITAPFFIGKAVAESKMVKDAVDVTVDTSKKAAKAVADTTTAVLDYPIDEGAKKAWDATADVAAAGYNATVDAANDYVVKPTVAAYEATADAANEYIVQPTIASVDAVDQAQQDARRGVADWISPDAPKAAPNLEQVQLQQIKDEEARVKAATPKAKIAAPKTPAETKAFQEKFNAWLASDEGKGAREVGITALKPDSIFGTKTKYALALINAE